MRSQLATPVTTTDLISFLKALPDCRMRRGIRFPQWWMLLAQLDVAEGLSTLVCDGKTLRGSIHENASGVARYGLRPTASTLPK